MFTIMVYKCILIDVLSQGGISYSYAKYAVEASNIKICIY